MSNITKVLEGTLIMITKLKYFKDEKITKEDLETVAKIREELTKLAGPEDIMSVKIIKDELNKKYVISCLPADVEAVISPNGIRHSLGVDDFRKTMYEDWSLDDKNDLEKHVNINGTSDKVARELLSKACGLTEPNKEDKGIISDVCTEIVKAIKYIESTYN